MKGKVEHEIYGKHEGILFMNGKDLATEFLKNYEESQCFFKACNLSGIEPKQTAETYYVYALIRTDTGEIVYIGKGKNQRMEHHMRDMRKSRVSGLKKHLGLLKLHKSGVEVEHYAIFEGLPQTVSYQVERAMIKALRHVLLNSSGGGSSKNERAIYHCNLLIERITPHSAMPDGLDRHVRDVFINWTHSEIEEIHIADQTGYDYEDYWDEARFKARAEYIGKNPHRRPRKRLQMAENWLEVI